jgi:hypothetical protein
MQSAKKNLARRLRAKGLTYTQIGERLGVTRQRAQQFLKPPIEVWLIVFKRAKGRCEDCGKQLENGHLHHRSYGAAVIDRPSNFDYLCRKCHLKRHGGRF